MRISDWSSDVCSSDLPDTRGGAGSRGTRQLGPKGSGLEAPNDRLRDQVKKKGRWLWFYEPRNRCRSSALSPQRSTPDSPITVGQPIFQFDLSFAAKQRRPLRQEDIDRKSTRLNYSH